MFLRKRNSGNSFNLSLKDHLEKLIRREIGSWILFILAVADASLLPAPVTTFFLIITSVSRKRSFEYVIVGTSGIIIGGITAYFTGRFLWFDQNNEFSEIARFILRNIPGFNLTSYLTIQSLFLKWDFWILFLVTFTPLPFGLFSLSSGAFHINPSIFILAVIVSNLIKFTFLSIITGRLEEKVRGALFPLAERIT